MSAEALAQVLRPLEGMFNSRDYPHLLAGLESPDDAAVWKLDEERAVILTTDFFTPIVDDPYDYGAIAAANSLSDIYAMGGEPFLALNIAALPPNLPIEIVSEILRGGAEMVKRAGAVLAGGHTIQDKEPKYGLVVMGFLDPKKMITKGGAQPGDRLILTKPLGSGVITTAFKQDKAPLEDLQESVIWMKTLNDQASRLARQIGVRSGTDITGFSLLGHAWEMAQASRVGLRFEFKSIPILPAALRCAQLFTFPGGASNNKLHFSRYVRFTSPIDENRQMLLYDPQTSGGLLLAVPENRAEAFLEQANSVSPMAWLIGEVTKGEGIEVV